MKITFKSSSDAIKDEERYTSVNWWSWVFSVLRKEHPELGIDEFYTWLESEWKCKTILGGSIVNGLAGVDIEDQYLTMLMLRFPVQRTAISFI
jgi:hypothetical protein